MDGGRDRRRLAGPVLVSVAYLLLFYCFMVYQSASKLWLWRQARGKAKKEGKPDPGLKYFKYGEGSRHGLALRSDRVFLNMHEQTAPFLLALWLHAVFSDATRATWLGSLYVCFRASYFFTFGHGALIICSTGPMYAIISALTLPVAWQAWADLAT